MRINKYISHNSKYSRREADKLIEAGEVSVNRKKIEDFSYDVKEDDEVSINGLHVKERTELTMIVFNKPKGTLVTRKDDRGRTTIYHKLAGKFRHFIPVGRLDYASEGILILTNSPTVADVMMKGDLNRTYNIKIDKPFSNEMEEAMREGLILDDARAGGHEKDWMRACKESPEKRIETKSSFYRYLRLASPLIIQFTFGALLSASLIFYWFSGVLSVSWPFMILITILIISNDVFRDYYQRPLIQIGVYFL